jgi:hypothetical protein
MSGHERTHDECGDFVTEKKKCLLLARPFFFSENNNTLELSLLQKKRMTHPSACLM